MRKSLDPCVEARDHRGLRGPFLIDGITVNVSVDPYTRESGARLCIWTMPPKAYSPRLDRRGRLVFPSSQAQGAPRLRAYFAVLKKSTGAAAGVDMGGVPGVRAPA